jgi:hypothetical protein
MREAEIAFMPDNMLLHNIKSTENILANPSKFPGANLDNVRAWHGEMVAAAVRRGLSKTTQTNAPLERMAGHKFRH